MLVLANGFLLASSLAFYRDGGHFQRDFPSQQTFFFFPSVQKLYVTYQYHRFLGSRCRKHKKQTQKKKKIEGQDDDDDVVDTITDVSGSTVIDISCSAKSF